MIDRTKTILKHFARLAYRKSQHADNFGDLVYEAVAELGGLYVKLMQFVCLRTDIFSDTEKVRFLSFYDRVEPEILNIGEFLKSELSPSQLRQIASVEEKPFAAGSFAQVYRGKLSDGNTIIVKVKRREITQKLKQDFVLLKVFARIFNLLYYQKYVDVLGLLKEFKRLSYAELDYEREAKSAQFFYDMYRNHPIVVIPKTYPQLSTNNMIVQEYVSGVSLTTLIRYRFQKLDYKKWLLENYNTDIFKFLENIPYEMALQMFNSDIYYADPHPGNILILRDNRYAIIDFGILGRSPRNKRTYYNLMKTAIEKSDSLDTEKLGSEFLQFGSNEFYKNLESLEPLASENSTPVKSIVVDNYKKSLDGLKEKFRSVEQSGRDDFTTMFMDVLQAGNKYNVKIPDELLALIRSSQIYKSYSTFLEPEWHSMRETYRRILKDVDPSKLLNADDVNQKTIRIEDALESVSTWAGDLVERDLSLYQRINSALNSING